MHNSLTEKFREQVYLKYHLYNSLFITLPYSGLSDKGIQLPLFTEMCRKQLYNGSSPKEIVDDFFKNVLHIENQKDKISVLFLFLQMVERQVVLFDALEDAAFMSIHDLRGSGTLHNFLSNVESVRLEEHTAKILETYCIRIILTAHPTQFYPENILNLIQDLYEAIKADNLIEIDTLLLQLGKTSFRNIEKVTCLSEASNLIHRNEEVFYQTICDIHKLIFSQLFPHLPEFLKPVIELGFWPGGDRDGNPNVKIDTTLKIVQVLKSIVIHHYIKDLEHLQHKLTFPGIEILLNRIETKLKCSLESNINGYIGYKDLLADLKSLKEYIRNNHQGLFLELIDQFIIAVSVFGFHFGTLDIRQEASIHSQTLQAIFDISQDLLPAECQKYQELSSDEKLNLLQILLEKPPLPISYLEDSVFQDVLDVLKNIPAIQMNNGEKALHRYIISNAEEAYNVLEVLLLAYWANIPLNDMKLDIVPLFESVASLRNSRQVMRTLYDLPIYKEHLKRRASIQTIMVGFSDGTKDGGYFTCNWEIFKCKQALVAEGAQKNIGVIFFDGRGGPPSRGGGNSHQFYRALSYQLPQREIHLTIQGQTISSNFGIPEAAKFNLEQLFTAGLEGILFPDNNDYLNNQDCQLLDQLSALSLKKYLTLKNHSHFIPYLEKITPLKYYGRLNISSRPTKRKSTGPLNLRDLRAIPFVGAWTQMKQNIPGYFGLGTALKELIDQGFEDQLKDLYKSRLFFRTLIDNAMQSLSKSFLPLTEYLKNDPEFGELWRIIQDETILATEQIAKISGSNSLMENDPIQRQSIALREEMLLPLLVIQHYAMIMNRNNPSEEDSKIYDKLILKSIPPIINATRNAV